jgi:DNA-directed RNA polymerase subunit K/omega
MSMNKLLGDLLEEAENRYGLIIKVARLAKQIKEETKELEGTTNPVIQALQEIAAERDGTLLVDSK